MTKPGTVYFISPVHFLNTLFRGFHALTVFVCSHTVYICVLVNPGGVETHQDGKNRMPNASQGEHWTQREFGVNIDVCVCVWAGGCVCVGL